MQALFYTFLHSSLCNRLHKQQYLTVAVTDRTEESKKRKIGAWSDKPRLLRKTDTTKCGLQLFHILRTHFGAALSIHASRNDATSIAGSLTAREEPLDADMLQGFTVANNADRGGGASLRGYQYSLVGQEAMRILAESLESFLQALAHK